MKAHLSRKRAASILAAVVLIVAVTLSLFFYMNYTANYSRQLQPIVLGNLPLESSALLYVAQKQGFFTQNGINVTIRDYDTGLASTNALLNGEVDIAGAAEYPIVRLALQNQSIQTIAVINKSALENLMCRRDHGIENVSDLKGKTIALPQGTIAEFYLARLLSLNNVSMSDVTLVNMTLSQSADALVNGDVDAIVNWQPYTNAVADRLGGNAVVWSVQSSQQSYGVMICRDDWVAANPDLVNKFLKALAQAEDFINSNPAEAKAIMKNQMNFTDVYMETVWKQNQFSLSLDNSLVVAMEDEARWMIRSNLTNATSVPNFLHYIYLDGLMSVKPESVNIIH
jgi:aliphatic sulfonates family ABC transporter substrate-binding protein